MFQLAAAAAIAYAALPFHLPSLQLNQRAMVGALKPATDDMVKAGVKAGGVATQKRWALAGSLLEAMRM
jgi:hypothetical protein